ncbi:MAG: ABC transporter permease [Bdellovibrionota bacterium]|nr:ABC transporter permease [Bdellovibrionota bacterium]
MKVLTNTLAEIGGLSVFVQEMFSVAYRKGIKQRDVLEQVWKVFIQSFPTTAMAGFFVGGILTLQFTLQVKTFGALGFLGGLATSSTVREVGPLLIAFMLSGKIGAFTSAELGTMRVTEQIDAIRCLGADPLQEIILPRFLGIIFASFFLLVGGLFMSIFGGMLMGVLFSGINPEEYIRHIPTLVSKVSLINSVFKCFVFAFVLAAICTYKGYTASGGSKGVGIAVVSTSVQTMICLVFMDWFTSVISDAFFTVVGS